MVGGGTQRKVANESSALPPRPLPPPPPPFLSRANTCAIMCGQHVGVAWRSARESACDTCHPITAPSLSLMRSISFVKVGALPCTLSSEQRRYPREPALRCPDHYLHRNEVVGKQAQRQPTYSYYVLYIPLSYLRAERCGAYHFKRILAAKAVYSPVCVIRCSLT